jgi:hypothetical protein
MDLNLFTQKMDNQAQAIRSLVQGLSDEQARWKPDPEAWSILEVINHLYDEEREDFRTHLDCCLHHPERPWSSIDPQGWVTQRRYNERHAGESLNKFLAERQKSIAWLRGLSAPNWEATYTAPFGPIRAGDLFGAWVAHDLLHLRQLVELHWAYTNRAVQPYTVRYAGEW